MRQVAFVALFVLAGILMPILIWFALFAALRKPLVRVIRRVAYAALFFLTGMLIPLLIWAAFAVTIRKLLLRGVPWLIPQRGKGQAGLRSPVRYTAIGHLILLTAIMTPILIWVAVNIIERR